MDPQAFPRNWWPLWSYVPIPLGRSPDLKGRTEWAAHYASRALAEVLRTPGSGRPIDAVMFRLALFDKVYEM